MIHHALSPDSFAVGMDVISLVVVDGVDGQAFSVRTFPTFSCVL